MSGKVTTSFLGSNVALIQKEVSNAGPTVKPQRGEYSLLFGRAGEAFQQEIIGRFQFYSTVFYTHYTERMEKKPRQKPNLRCGSTIIIASFSDITSWQNWSPTLARIYLEVSRSIPSAGEEDGIQRLMASGSLCCGFKKPSTRSIPFRVNTSLHEKGWSN